MVVGNLEAGGTGKTPMVEYLMRMLPTKRVAYLSRGYGRESKGLREVLLGDVAMLVGDEAAQVKAKFPDAKVFVCERRAVALSHIERQHPDVEFILLDDAFQHRAITPTASMLLTRFDRLFIHDQLIPVGRLREPASAAKRADIILVTKCPADMTDSVCFSTRAKLAKFEDQPLFFTSHQQEPPIQIAGPEWSDQRRIGVLTGIAHAAPLIEGLSNAYEVGEHFEFPDHHPFTSNEVEAIVSQAKSLKLSAIFTTEKDVQRLQKYIENGTFAAIPLLVVPVTIQFLFDSESRFKKTVHDLLRKH